MTEWRNKK